MLHCMCILLGERMVNVGGAVCACGGTHVKNTADIRGVTVTKIKKVSLGAKATTIFLQTNLKPTKFLAHPRMYQTTHELQTK